MKSIYMKKNPAEIFTTIETDPNTGEYYTIIPEWIMNDMNWYEETKLNWNIDTEEVIKAAQTKWNFVSYTPGLVGGHCIGVDPYYLTFKANEIGYFPELILAGRNINNHMGEYIFKEITKLMAKNNISSLNAKILILGFTFKENCTDFRNTRVIDLVNGFKEMNCNVSVFDPCADKDDILKEYSIELLENLQQNFFDVIILAVPHDKFKKMGISNIRKFGKKKHIIYDIKHLFKFEDVDGRL